MINKRNVGIASGVAGVLVLLLSFFVTYMSFVPGIGVIILGAAAIVMGKDNGGEIPTMPIVGIALGAITLIVAAIAAISGQTMFQILGG